MISDFQHFPNNAFETAEFWCIVGLTAILRFFIKEKLLFLQPEIFIVAYWKSVEPWKLLSDFPSED